jgi:hypothetical protein
MLWFKWWLDTRFWFLLAVAMLAAQVLALYVSYPMDPQTSYPAGALGVLPAEMGRLRGDDFRGYVWVRWFSTTMLLMWPVYVFALAGTGFERAAGREYLLSLPVSRRRIIATRLAVVLTQIAAFTLLPSMLLSAMAPLRGQHYPVADAVVHSGILFVAGLGLFGLTIVLRTLLADAAAYTAAAALVGLVGLFTFIVDDFTPYSIFRLMNGAEYFFNHRVPWSGLAASATMGMAFIWLSMRIVEARDY